MMSKEFPVIKDKEGGERVIPVLEIKGIYIFGLMIVC